MNVLAQSMLSVMVIPRYFGDLAASVGNSYTPEGRFLPRKEDFCTEGSF